MGTNQHQWETHAPQLQAWVRGRHAGGAGEYISELEMRAGAYRLHSAQERVAFRLFLTSWLWLDMDPSVRVARTARAWSVWWGGRTERDGWA